MMLIESPRHLPDPPTLALPAPRGPSLIARPPPPELDLSKSPLELGKAQWEKSRSKTKSIASNPPGTSTSTPVSTSLSSAQSSTPSLLPVTNTTSTSTHTTSSQPQVKIRRATPKDAAAIAHLGGSTFAASFGFSIPAPDLKAYLDEAYNVDAIRAELMEMAGSDLRSTLGDDSLVESGYPLQRQCEIGKVPRDRRKCFFVATISSPSSKPPKSLKPLKNQITANEDGYDGSSESERDETRRSRSPPSPSSPSSSEQIVGFIQLTPEPLFHQQLYQLPAEPSLSHLPVQTLIELQRIYVSRTHHGLGIGKLLLTTALTHSRRLGYEDIWLGVWEGNFVAQRVYENQGFERAGDHEFKMGRCIQTDWIMVREL